MTVTCPLDGCDYSGLPSGVEAHISSKTDSVHKGKSGSEFRADLEAQQDDSSDGSRTTGSTSDGDGDDGTDDSGASESVYENGPVSDNVVPSPPPEPSHSGGSSGSETSQVTGNRESDGNDDTSGSVVLVALAVAAVWFIALRSGGNRQQGASYR